MADGEFSSSNDTYEGQSHSYSIDSPASSDDDGAKSTAKSIGKSLVKQGMQKMSDSVSELTAKNPGVRSYRKGGKVRKTGMIHAHKNEEVVRKEDAPKVRKFLKKTTGREQPRDGERLDDIKKSFRKGDPKRFGKKEEPDRTAKKEAPNRTAHKGDPSRMTKKIEAKRAAGARKGKRGKGKRKLSRGM